MTAVSIAQAAAELGLSPRQVRYAVQRGAPTIRRGGKGRGRRTLLDPVLVAAWLKTNDPDHQAERRKLARSLIEAIAETTSLQFRTETGPHKTALLEVLLATFYQTAATILRAYNLPPLDDADVPANIRKMDKASVHFRRSDTVRANPRKRGNL